MNSCKFLWFTMGDFVYKKHSKSANLHPATFSSNVANRQTDKPTMVITWLGLEFNKIGVDIHYTSNIPTTMLLQQSYNVEIHLMLSTKTLTKNISYWNFSRLPQQMFSHEQIILANRRFYVRPLQLFALITLFMPPHFVYIYVFVGQMAV